MNNNPPPCMHCFSCGKDLPIPTPDHKQQKHEYPVCNQKSDCIILEKHFLCRHCECAFDKVKTFVNKYHLKSFNKDFKLDRIIDSSFIKMSHFDSVFTKESNKRQSEIFESTTKEESEKQSNSVAQSKQSPLQFNLNLPTDIYSAIINDSIESQTLHHVHWLPKTLQYLIHLTALQRMRPQERRQRTKKTLQAVSYIYCVDESELKYLAIIIQTLFCYMDEEALMKILDRLLKGFLQNNVSLGFFLVEEQGDDLVVGDCKVFEQRHLNKKPVQFRPDSVLYLVFSMFILFDFFKDGKLQRHFSQLVHLSHQELNHHSSTKPLQKAFQTYLTTHISDHSKLPKLTQTSWQQLIENKKQRNYLNLIISTMKKQQQENQELIKDMENKYKKEKDEYINKIVRLSNQIEDLEGELKGVREGAGRKGSRVVRLGDDIEEVRSNPEAKIDGDAKEVNIDSIHLNKNDPITQRTQFTQPCNQNQSQLINKKHKSQIQTPKQLNTLNESQQIINSLRCILQITDIINFNNKTLCKKSKKESASLPIPCELPQLPSTMQQLSQLIISEIDTLQKKLLSLVQQNKKLKEQSSRLLSILKRKQESWLPLLHEKDQIISLYEKALICMEKGYILAEEPLSSRIQAIVESVAKVQFRKLSLDVTDDNTSMRDSTSVRDSFVEEFSDDVNINSVDFKAQKQQESPAKTEKKTPAKEKKHKQAKSAGSQKSGQNKIKKKTKKQKEKQTECIIY